jgi:hypothetical protein
MEVQDLKTQATAMLQQLITAATQTGEFIKEQVPLVIRELLAFNIALRIAQIVAGLFLVVVAALWLRYGLKLHKAAREAPGYYDGAWGFGALVPWGIATGVAGMMLVQGTIDLLKLTLAPRVWLIEYAAALVK